ncbi:hypothetical protein A9236_00035 [Polynucleobacter sp. QLW-P1DATA-2]|uniref:hypothetical protein n=1 Tax=unclassified Polynucleobacter TaxID=2640945 RepID=UPI0008F919C6|nr:MULTISPECIES: hypothetical protein [unclassified Polynucleobacter]OIM97775.1 hypothetical protein A9235_10780 [Polynucleobacter sp. MWH-Tro8-2-5-gr]OIN03345.1 hypothetical protein A9236_00035 [Polynucleobacter sp. QLW-P1DATA-2]
MSTNRAIAVRLFINDKFNSTFGKGLFRKAIFNGTIEIKSPNTKFLIDLYQYSQWEALAKNDIQMQTIRELSSTNIPTEDDFLFSWIVHYDPSTKTKTAVKGYLVYSPQTNELYVNINSPEFGTVEQWELNTHPCKAVGIGIPAVIASTADLANW